MASPKLVMKGGTQKSQKRGLRPSKSGIVEGPDGSFPPVPYSKGGKGK